MAMVIHFCISEHVSEEVTMTQRLLHCEQYLTEGIQETLTYFPVLIPYLTSLSYSTKLVLSHNPSTLETGHEAPESLILELEFQQPIQTLLLQTQTLFTQLIFARDLASFLLTNLNFLRYLRKKNNRLFYDQLAKI